MVGVEQWAEIRRMHRVERLSIREISRRTGLHRKTIRRALVAQAPPKYERAPGGSKLDPFKEWICERLREDPSIQSLRLREMASELGYAGGKTIFDDYVREVRPRFQVRRTFQRTIYRPGELVQCDLWEPRDLVPVGHGQTRRGWVVTAELCWSRVIAGALIFSKQAPDILWGLGRCLGRIGACIERSAPSPPSASSRSSARMRPLPDGDARHRPAAGDCGSRSSPICASDRNDYSLDPRLVGRRVEVRVSQREIIAVALDTGELACRHRRVFAGGLTITDPAHQTALERQRARRRQRARGRGRGPAAGPL